MIADRQNAHLEGYHPKIGGSADKNGATHGGTRVERPAEMPTRDECDYVVETKTALLKRLSEDNATVYIDADIDLTGVESHVVGNGVTLVGGFCDPERTEHGGMGPKLYVENPDPADQSNYPRHVFKHTYGPPMKLYGVVFEGPERRYFDPRERASSNSWYSDATQGFYSSAFYEYAGTSDGTFEAVGCCLYGWTVAAIELGSRANETSARVHRCSLFDCMMESMGYGIQQYNGELDVSWCYMDAMRHYITGFGYGSQWYDVWNCLFGPSDLAGHGLDQHCLANNLSTDSRLAGKYIRVRNCTFRATGDVSGDPQEAIAIRGRSDELSWIDKCHFAHSGPPTPSGTQGDAIRQETEWTDEPDRWHNLDVRDNIYGAERPEKKLSAYGAPRDPSDPQDEHENRERSRIEIAAGVDGQWVDYSIRLTGTASARGNVESHDRLSNADGTVEIIGRVRGGTDGFDVAPDVTLLSATATAPIRVSLNGDAVDMAPLLSIGAHRRLDDIEKSETIPDMKSIEKTLTRVKRTANQAAKKLDNARIAFK